MVWGGLGCKEGFGYSKEITSRAGTLKKRDNKEKALLGVRYKKFLLYCDRVFNFSLIQCTES